ncbi:hypothetical protein ABZ629_23260, partial [Streptomyces sp. NPDC007110]
MTDYGHELSFGLSLDPTADALEETRRLARRADDGGLDYLAVQDTGTSPTLDDVVLAGELAGRAAVAIDNARWFQ